MGQSLVHCFKRHPDADTNKDDKLTWREYKVHKTALDAREAERELM